MPLSKKRNAELMRKLEVEQAFYRVKVGVCSACHRIAPIHRHHPDYSKPKETLLVCASCHKKLHLCLAGKQRTTSCPYINPLTKMANKQPKPPEPSVEDILIARDYLDNADVPTEDRKLEPMPLYIDADGNIVYD